MPSNDAGRPRRTVARVRTKKDRQADVAWRKAIGAAIRAAREGRGMAIADLAFAVGMSDSAVNHLELGNRAPDFATLDAIADALQLSVDQVLGRVPGTITPPTDHPGVLSNEVARLRLGEEALRVELEDANRRFAFAIGELGSRLSMTPSEVVQLLQGPGKQAS